eukprot:TRINITY_DN2001_c0_g1_i1.p1 TRINITY_DN2001_c0_g1~~TRINITY_DN2001_c0_g1_i1.p1  ORF type:complete len:450 (+),score=71.44 TRINITY_DN2001_c0_g1_i1:178-1527(+)
MGKGEGKGEGKGGCLEELCDALFAGVACLCCLLFAGPVLIIVGVAVLASTSNDDRADRISQFNDLTAAWNQYGYQDFSTNTSFGVQFNFSNCANAGQVDGGPFILQGGASPPDDIESDSDRVDFQQWKYSLPSFPTQSQSIGGCQLEVEFLRLNPDGSQQSSVGSAQAAVQTTRTTTVCQSNERTSTCSQRCSNNYGGSYNSFSRQCTYTDTLSGVCIKVDESAIGARDWTKNSQLPGQGTGCYWDSDSNFFDETKTSRNGNVNSIQVMVRSARGPYLNFEFVTDGSGSFGLTIGQKIAIGISCIVIGLLFISVWVLTIYCCCKMLGCCGGERPQAPPNNPVGQFYYGAANRYGQYIPGYQPQPQQQQQTYATAQPVGPYQGQPEYYQQQPPYNQPPQQYQYGQPYEGQPYGGAPAQGQPYNAPPAGYPQPQPYGAPPSGQQDNYYKYN